MLFFLKPFFYTELINTEWDYYEYWIARSEKLFICWLGGFDFFNSVDKLVTPLVDFGCLEYFP